MPIKVTKFGGSSLADAAQFEKVREIIASDPDRRYIVPSAPGKRFSEDDKVTDLLYSCYKAAGTEAFEAIFDKITGRFNDIITGLKIDMSLNEEFEKIKAAFIHRAGRDYAASRGEYLNGLVLAYYLRVPFIDAADVIFFNEDGSFDSERTNEELSKVLAKNPYAVIPGFYGSMPNDTIKTFSRGGSDITGAIVARAAKADIYENWTDVSGFLAADPRIVKDPRVIDIITYRELRELSYMGASVLHEEAVFPVRIAGIPINIKNTNAPADKGTLIVDSIYSKSSTTITGIAGKKGFCSINIEKDMMNSELGFGRKVLQVLEKLDVSFEHMPSGIDSLSVIVSAASVEGREELIKAAIQEAVGADHIEIESDLALIAVVGRGMKQSLGTAARLFTGISASGVNVRMIDQGSSELNIIIGVDESEFEKTLNAIYCAFENN